MRKPAPLMGVALFMSLIFSTDGFAQAGMMWSGSGGWGAGMGYGMMFDPKTVETIQGEVVSVDPIVPLKGMSSGIHMMLKTGGETLPVHLGPEWYIRRQDTRIEPKDSVEVTGSRIMFEGKPAIIAVSVKKGDETLILRDEHGVPVWSGWHRRR